MLVIVLFVLTWGAMAHAEEAPPASATQLAQAREAFRLGTALAKQGQWADALAAFQRSHRLHAHPTTMYNVGYCERALARFTRARRAFLQALADNAEQGGDKLTPTQVAETHGFLKGIDERLARAVVEIARPGTRIAVDGRPLELSVSAAGGLVLVAGTRDPARPEPPPGASFTVVLDAGDRVFALSHADGRSRALTVHFEPGETKHVTLDVGAGDRPALEPAQRATEPVTVIGDLRPAGAVALGIGGAGLVAAVVAGAIAIDAKASLDEVCPTPERCPRQEQGTIDRLQTSAKVASVAAAMAVAGGALGLSLMLMSEPPADGDEGPTELGVVLSPGWVGLGGRF
jgi:hypothetical protein